MKNSKCLADQQPRTCVSKTRVKPYVAAPGFAKLIPKQTIRRKDIRSRLMQNRPCSRLEAPEEGLQKPIKVKLSMLGGYCRILALSPLLPKKIGVNLVSIDDEEEQQTLESKTVHARHPNQELEILKMIISLSRHIVC